MAAEEAVEEGSLRSADGTRLHWRVWPVAEPRLFLAVVHGLGEHGGRYATLARAMAPFGFATAAVDLRGMGRSDGRRGHVDSWQCWVDDCEAFVEHVRGYAGSVEVVPLGHSFGGVVVCSAIVRGVLAVERFVLSNPAFRVAVEAPAWQLGLARIASRVAPTLTLSNRVAPALISRDAAVVDAYRHDPLVHDRISLRLLTEWQDAAGEALRRADEIAAPFLVIVSGDDHIVDRSGSEQLDRQARVGHRLDVFPHRYHEPFNDFDAAEVFTALASWLEQPTQLQ